MQENYNKKTWKFWYKCRDIYNRQVFHNISRDRKYFLIFNQKMCLSSGMCQLNLPMYRSRSIMNNRAHLYNVNVLKHQDLYREPLSPKSCHMQRKCGPTFQTNSIADNQISTFHTQKADMALAQLKYFKMCPKFYP